MLMTDFIVYWILTGVVLGFLVSPALKQRRLRKLTPRDKAFINHWIGVQK